MLLCILIDSLPDNCISFISVTSGDTLNFILITTASKMANYS